MRWYTSILSTCLITILLLFLCAGTSPLAAQQDSIKYKHANGGLFVDNLLFLAASAFSTNQSSYLRSAEGYLRLQVPEARFILYTGFGYSNFHLPDNEAVLSNLYGYRCKGSFLKIGADIITSRHVYTDGTLFSVGAHVIASQYREEGTWIPPNNPYWKDSILLPISPTKHTWSGLELVANSKQKLIKNRLYIDSQFRVAGNFFHKEDPLVPITDADMMAKPDWYVPGLGGYVRSGTNTVRIGVRVGLSMPF